MSDSYDYKNLRSIRRCWTIKFYSINSIERSSRRRITHMPDLLARRKLFL
jgi:hypothetical protein